MYASKDEFPSDLMPLAQVNQHQRDRLIKFFEDTHSYVFDDILKFPISASGVWAKFFSDFNPEEIVEKYFDRWAWNESSEYYNRIWEGRNRGFCDDYIKLDIINGWRAAGDEASKKGTYMSRSNTYLNDE